MNLDQFISEMQARWGVSEGRSRQEWNWIHQDSSSPQSTVQRRVKEGYPLAYLLGSWEFFGLPIKVNSNVLIPRPETETLVEQVIKDHPLPPNMIVDVGTGSGCMAKALSTHWPTATVIGVDISFEAGLIARQNCPALDFLQGDLLSALRLPRGTLVVANLPYIPDNRVIDPQVINFEPRLALFGGPQGWELIDRLWSQIKVQPGLAVYIEFDPLAPPPPRDWSFFGDYDGSIRFAKLNPSERGIYETS